MHNISENIYFEPFRLKKTQKSKVDRKMFLPLQINVKYHSINLLNFVDMTKAEIVADIASKTGVEKVAVQAVVESFMEVVKTSMINGENVYLRGFGSFIIKRRAEKTGRNISKNTTIIIPAHNIPAFKPAKSFVNQVKENTK